MADVEDLSRLAIDRGLELDADYIEFRFQAIYNENLVMKNGVLTAHKLNYSYGIGIRVLVDGSLGFSSTNIITENNIIRAVESAIKIARASRSIVKNDIQFSEEETNNVDYFIAEKKRWTDVSINEKVSFLEDLDDEISNLTNNAKINRLFNLIYKNEEKYVSTSMGTEIKSIIPLTTIYYVFTIKKNDDVLQKNRFIGGSGGFEAVYSHNFFEKIVNHAKELVEIINKWRSAPTGRMDIVVDSEVAGIIAHECVGHPFEADRILGREGAQAGESYVKQLNIGDRIGSDEVNVSDDPTIPSSGGYYLFDDEGVKARKKELIVNGYINELLHNRETAFHFNTNSNGSARASSYDREPIIRMSNTYFEPGDYSLNELIEDINYGIYMKGYMEWNIDDKRINQRYTGLEAYLIEKGEIKYPIKYPVLEVPTTILLKQLDARGRNLEFYVGICGKGDPYQLIPVWFGGPALRFRKIYIGVR